MTFLFRGLTRSSSINDLSLNSNRLSVDGLRSMVQFLQNANNLESLELDYNNIQSEGFDVVVRALHNSHIESLNCSHCGINPSEIDNNCFPQHLTCLHLNYNNINADGCRELARLLQGENATLAQLYLNGNKINDDGVAFLVDALQTNTSLETLYLMGNDDISDRGELLLLKLVNNISSIEVTLQSNHTLTHVSLSGIFEPSSRIEIYINIAVSINKDYGREAGRNQVIQSQLCSDERAVLCNLQEVVEHSVFSEINPLHLPEVLALIGHYHGQGELFCALSSSMLSLLSTVNVEKCIQRRRDYHLAQAAELTAKVEEHNTRAAELDAKLALMKQAARGNDRNNNMEQHSNKRRRKW